MPSEGECGFVQRPPIQPEPEPTAGLGLPQLRRRTSRCPSRTSSDNGTDTIA